MLCIFDGNNSLLIDKYFFINDMTYIICITEKIEKRHDKLTIIVV
jgi:hypothetical protein